MKFATHHLRTIRSLKGTKGPSTKRYEDADEVLSKVHLTEHGVSLERLPAYVMELSNEELCASLKAACVVERWAYDSRACSLYLHLAAINEYTWKHPTTHHRFARAVVRALKTEGDRRIAAAKALISAIRKASPK